MIEIRNAEASDLDDIMEIHVKCLEELKKLEEEQKEIMARTFIDPRSRAEIFDVVKKKLSYVVLIDSKVEGYFLYDKAIDGLISKGLILQERAQGLGIVKMVHKMMKRGNENVYYIVSKYNFRNQRHMLNLGLVPKGTTNVNDILYG
jgi:hypothetical protein